MTINNILALSHSITGGDVDEKEIIMWISQLEANVVFEIGLTHEGFEGQTDIITENSDRDRNLFIPEPYSDIYIQYITMKNDLRLRDITRYVNSAAVFGSSFSDFADLYNRTHKPLSKAQITV